MRSQQLVIMIFFIVTGLLLQVGCRKNEVFYINGIWNVDQKLSCQDGSTSNDVISYRFAGSETEGTIERYPNSPGGVFSGSYKVADENVSFSYTYGRASTFYNYTYTGRIYLENDTMMGTMERKVFQSGEVTFLCQGTFVATR